MSESPGGDVSCRNSAKKSPFNHRKELAPAPLGPGCQPQNPRAAPSTQGSQGCSSTHCLPWHLGCASVSRLKHGGERSAETPPSIGCPRGGFWQGGKQVYLQSKRILEQANIGACERGCRGARGPLLLKCPGRVSSSVTRWEGKRDFKPSCRDGEDSFPLFLFSFFFVSQIGIIWDYRLCCPGLMSLSATLPTTSRTLQRTLPWHTLPPISHLPPASHPARSQGRWETGRAPWRAQQGQGRVVLWPGGEAVPHPSHVPGAGGC